MDLFIPPMTLIVSYIDSISTIAFSLSYHNFLSVFIGFNKFLLLQLHLVLEWHRYMTFALATTEK